ncbi:hypothetical protein G7059_03655 [Erysipelothrix sp. HDW6A]|uniref:hypothetical protein n=1 Tax=Erysipelothrix sp. HDW6A TaxID=2714928 RepID=UPI0014094BDB|nr:hypothetical protein [Erysipelothrix sp. HDW6A]QIK57007.1 hypothetical protein G7059_03655 [Erysipelothrix sp. HDW6A]
MQEKILQTIQDIRELDGNIQVVLLRGGCYQFAKYLKRHFPEGDIYLTQNMTHAVFKYDDSYYDIQGQREKAEKYIPLPEDTRTLEEIESWNSIRNIEFNDRQVVYLSTKPIKEIPVGGKFISVDDEGKIYYKAQTILQPIFRISMCVIGWMLFYSGYLLFNNSLQDIFKSASVIEVLKKPALYVVGMVLYLLFVLLKESMQTDFLDRKNKVIESLSFKSMVLVVGATFLVLLGGTEEYSIIRELIPVAVGLKILTFVLFEIIFLFSFLTLSRQTRITLFEQSGHTVQMGVPLRGGEEH